MTTVNRRRAACWPSHPASHVPHEPHGHRGRICPGWSQEDADGTLLAERLDRLARDHAWPKELPAGVRLECHPVAFLVLQALDGAPDAEIAAPVYTGEVTARRQIPVIAAAGMARGAWRITADDGVIDEGVIRAA
jgi:hypothetical protein